MSLSFKIRGVIVPLVTPFQNNGDDVDEGAMAALCDWLVGKGVHGLMPCGTTGEGPLLSTAERKRLLEVVLAATRDRTPVIAHVGAATTRETIELALHARAAGVSAASIVTPYYFPVSQQAMVEHFCRVAQAVPDLPVYLYNIPSRTVNVFTAAGAEAVIARCPNVLGVKDSSGSLPSITSFIGLKQGQFQVTCGSDNLVLKALQAGAVATITGNGNAYPEVVVKLIEAFWQGDLKKAAHQQHILDKVRNLLQNGGDLSLLKRGIEFRGLKGGNVRPPLLEFSAADFEVIAEELKTVEL
jgi:4-hydroxy-tetrahydrodipicolinate synthase